MNILSYNPYSSRAYINFETTRAPTPGTNKGTRRKRETKKEEREKRGTAG